jgi:molybdopterin molybdotransferase
MIDYAQAIEKLLARAQCLPSEPCATDEAMGRVLSSGLISPIALPSFDHAAMDGYALDASTPLAAGSEYTVHGSQAAGDSLPAGGPGRDENSACEIMTGARLHTGLDAVVAVERTDCLAARADGTPTRIRLREALHVGHNVRRAGSDVAPGAPVLAAGTRVESAHIMLLAALGIVTVNVVRRVRVAIICTGRELQVDASQPLTEGHIHNSNGPYLRAALAAAGAQVMFCETVDDTAVTYAQALQRAIDGGADLVISTGAVSMGRFDFVPATLQRFDAQLLFHKVAIRPGKPVLCARLPAGPLVIALPGTPMAVAAGLRFMVMPVLRAWNGLADESPVHAILDTPQQPKAGMRHFLRAALYQHPGGELHVALAPQQQPFRIRPFADADVWVVLPEDAGDCPAGMPVDIVSLEPGAAPRIRSLS